VNVRVEPLPATTIPFDWNAMASGTSRYWQLSWALLGEQVARLADDGIVRDDRCDHPAPHIRYTRTGTLWTPAVDLAVDGPSEFTWFEKGAFVPARSARSIADSRTPDRLQPGVVLRLESVQADPWYEGMGTNFWSVADDQFDVRYIHSAFEGRWGGTAVLADALIVPIDHPIVRDPGRADRLVRDLQEITRAFRVRAGLPAEGELDDREKLSRSSGG
jgi:hypothetical protein